MPATSAGMTEGASLRTGRVVVPGSVGGAVAVAAILERAVADPVDRGAGEAVTGGSILDRAGVGETRDHDAGRQHGGRQTGVSLAGVSLGGISIDCHLHPPSWLGPRAPMRRQHETNGAGDDAFP